MKKASNKQYIAVILASIWISLSEFIRNEFFLKNYWINHYELLGLQFETLAINGVLWFVWSILLAIFLYKLLQKYTLKEVLFLSWIPVFLMMWITVFNLQVLPLALLLFAIPLSMLELYLAILIIRSLK